MKRKSVHKAMHIFRTMTEAGLHNAFRPLIIINVRSACDLEDLLILIVITNVCLISAIEISIIFRCHISTAAPVLITDSEIVNGPSFLMPVFLSLICHRRNALKGHILYPLRHLLHRSASDISINICLTAKLTAKFKKLMRTEAVVLYDSAPVRVDHFLSVFLRTDAILPMILVCKASARPAQHRNFHFFQRFHNIISHTVCIWNIGVFSHIKSFINTASQML